MDDVVVKIREAEKAELALYARKFKFSEHLVKYEDDRQTDKYDTNFFAYDGVFSEEERKKAQEYQEKKGAEFLKFIGRTRLPEGFAGEEGVTITMFLRDNDTSSWKTNDRLTFYQPTLEEVTALELKEYGAVYGEGFTQRNIACVYEKEACVGAYLDGKLVANCVPFETEEFVGIDGVLVDSAYRKQYICTSLLKAVVDAHREKKIYLHADEEDTPKELYAKLGFETVDREYDYFTKIEKQK